MNLSDLKNKKIAILGFGIEGQAVGKYLEEQGLAFDFFDRKSGANYLDSIKNYDILFRSPGVNLAEPKIIEAAKAGAIITSQIKYFFDNCPAKIIGVTGTKGKGTTSKLIYEMLKASGINCYLGGNIGLPVLDLLGKLLPDDFVVLELSSFQLIDMQKSPHIAVVLMTTSEHLDYHENTEEYVTAKMPITKFQGKDDFAVINYDFEASRKIGDLSAGKKYYFHTSPKVQLLADFGFAEDALIANKASGKIVFLNDLDSDTTDGDMSQKLASTKEFLNAKDLVIPGYHNVQNVCAAILAAKIASADLEIIKQSAKKFLGLAHRLEFVCERGEIKFYNDSYGTTPETCIAAVQSFSNNEIVIVGGYDKKGDYQGLAAELALQKNIKAVILIGLIALHLQKYLQEHNFSGKILTGAKNMTEVFGQIKTEAQSGDIVLLAPATASYDWYKNYEERGNDFKKLALQF
jgi:UDP-N-acetylmuramoylalanine--D-glutamate ligase